MSDLKRAYDLAIKTEEEGYTLYRNGVERSKHPFGKDILRFLAKEELKHKSIIKKVMTGIIDGQESPKDAKTMGLDAMEGKTIFSEAINNPEAKFPGEADDLAVLKAGVEFEDKGIKFFAEAAKNTENAEARRFFEIMSREEKAHKALLLSSIEYLESPETWFESQNPIILDGV